MVQIVFCTIDSVDAARRIALQLVEERLAACVNIIDNVTSVYKWEGDLEEDKELLKEKVFLSGKEFLLAHPDERNVCKN